MYEYIKGKVTEICENNLVLESYGIGYLLFVSLNTLTDIKQNEDVKLYVYEHIREDEYTLYGFYTKEERQVFRELLGVTGIGPKVAMNILSKFTIRELINYITLGDEKALSSVPGIGKKTANRMILELKDKFKDMPLIEHEEIIVVGKEDNGVRDDGIAALVSLGFDYHQASQLIDKAYIPEINLEELIKKALALKASI